MKNSNEILTLSRANNIDRSMRKVTGSDWSRERKWQTKNTIKLGIKKSIISREDGVMMMLTISGSSISQVGAPTPEFGVKTNCLARFLPKTVWKWKQLDREGAHDPSAPSPLDPPMPSAITLILFINWQKMVQDEKFRLNCQFPQAWSTYQIDYRDPNCFQLGFPFENTNHHWDFPIFLCI